MAGKWDSNLKRLVQANPQEFVDWLLKDAVVSRELSVEIIGFSRREDKDWLKERFMMLRDIIKDTEIYQFILQEGREEGREEGCEAFQRVILGVVQNRFPELAEVAAVRVKAVADLGGLQKLALDVASASSVDQVRTLLESLKQYDSH